MTPNKKNNAVNGIIFLVAFLAFVLVFTYLSLNLKNIDYGYDLQELTAKEKYLKEEIDKLRAAKAKLLKLERVEKVVIGKLGYQYPTPDQFVKVYKDEE